MSTPESILQILSRQTGANNLDCAECLGIGEQLVFDAENGQDYALCEACQGSGYNTLGLILNGLIQPPDEGFGPQELKAALGIVNQEPASLNPPVSLFRPTQMPSHAANPLPEQSIEKRLPAHAHPAAGRVKRIS